MKSQDFHLSRGFFVSGGSRFFGLSLSDVCRRLSKCPGVAFTTQYVFFWSSEDVRAEFTFNGHAYMIEPIGWDDDLAISPKDKEANLSEINQLRDYIAKFPKMKVQDFCQPVKAVVEAAEGV